MFLVEQSKIIEVVIISFYITNNPFIFIVPTDTNIILPLLNLCLMYSLLIKKTSYLILIEWPKKYLMIIMLAGLKDKNMFDIKY